MNRSDPALSEALDIFKRVTAQKKSDFYLQASLSALDRVQKACISAGQQMDELVIETLEGPAPLMHFSIAFAGRRVIEKYPPSKQEWSRAAHVNSDTGLPERNILVEALIQKGCSVDKIDDDGWSPLHQAVEERDVSMVELLMKQGADLLKKDAFGYTPLLKAAFIGHDRLIEALASSGIGLDQVTREGESIMHLLAYNHLPDRLVWAVQKGISINALDLRGNTPLHVAVGHQEAVAEKIMMLGADMKALDRYHMTPFLWMLTGSKTQLALKSLKFFKEPKDLLKINMRGQSFLHLAAQNPAMESPLPLIQSLIIDYGLDPNHQDDEGLTVLHLAAQNNDLELAKFLVSTGANMDLKERGFREQTAEECAANQSYSEVASYLKQVRLALEEQIVLAKMTDTILSCEPDVRAEEALQVKSDTSKKTMKSRL